MKLIFLAAIAAVSTPAAAQDLPVRLKDGATWTLTAEHSRRVEGAGEPQDWTLTTVKRLTWHAGEKGAPATILVTPVSATPGPNSPAGLAQARSLAIPATLVVSESLSPGEVVNRDAVRAEFLRLIPAASQQPVAVVDASTKAMIAAELATASRGQGFNLTLKKPVSGEVSQPNPLGGPPLRAVESVELLSIEGKTNRAVIVWRQSADPKSFKASVMGALEEMARNKVDAAKIAEFRSAMATASLKNESECFYEIDIPTGLARRGDCVMDYAFTVQGQTQKIFEHWTISQTVPDPS